MSMEIANWCRDNINVLIKQIDILQGITINEILLRNNTNVKHVIKKETNHTKFSFIIPCDKMIVSVCNYIK